MIANCSDLMFRLPSKTVQAPVARSGILPAASLGLISTGHHDTANKQSRQREALVPRTGTVQSSQTPRLQLREQHLRRHTDEGQRERASVLSKPEAWLGAPGSLCLPEQC